MFKRLTLAPHLSLNGIAERYFSASTDTARRRWYVLWLIAQGKSTVEITAITGYASSWLRASVRRYNRDGAHGFADLPDIFDLHPEQIAALSPNNKDVVPVILTADSVPDPKAEQETSPLRKGTVPQRSEPHRLALLSSELTNLASQLGLGLNADILTLQVIRHDPIQITLSVGQELVLGRGALRTDDPSYLDLAPYDGVDLGVSRRHVAIGHDDHEWWIEDLVSTNGTWLNGEKILSSSAVPLEVRNRLLLAHLELSIYLPHKVIFGAAVPIYGASSRPMRVVHVESDSPMREIMAMVLRQAHSSIQLRQFSSHEEMLPILETEGKQVDLFILDIRSPGAVNGLEAAQRIRQAAYPGHIVFSALESAPASAFLDSVAGEFYPKPNYIWEVATRLFHYRLDKGHNKTSVAPKPTNISAKEAPALPDQPVLEANLPELEALQVAPASAQVSTAVENAPILPQPAPAAVLAAEPADIVNATTPSVLTQLDASKPAVLEAAESAPTATDLESAAAITRLRPLLRDTNNTSSRPALPKQRMGRNILERVIKALRNR